MFINMHVLCESCSAMCILIFKFIFMLYAHSFKPQKTHVYADVSWEQKTHVCPNRSRALRKAHRVLVPSTNCFCILPTFMHALLFIVLSFENPCMKLCMDLYVPGFLHHHLIARSVKLPFLSSCLFKLPFQFRNFIN